MELFALKKLKEEVSGLVTGETGEPYEGDIDTESFNTDYQRGAWQAVKLINEAIREFENQDADRG